MKRLDHHPAAKLFPMLSDSELDELAAKIKEHGQLEDIVTLDGKILDGRNREEACHRAGVTPRFRDFHDLFGTTTLAMSPTAWVLAKNLDRRHLNESQRALAAAEALPLLEAEARSRQKTGKKAPSPSSPRPLPPRGGKAGSAERRERTSAAVAAKAVGASSRSVERAKAVMTKRPELVDQIKAAKLTLKQAEKAIKREEQVKQVLEYRPPAGTYSVVVTDVPWRYDDELDGSDQARAGTGYPTMSVEEICAIKVPAAADCALWFWVTTAFLIDGTAARVLEAWGFEAKTMLTWVKDRFGAGRYLRNQTEHCILAVRGKPLITGEATSNVLYAPRRGHSEKPDEFFKLVEQVCPAKDRLELFARREREGWVTSGAELPKGPEKKRRANMRFVDAAAET
jgi:N6-adenosine-specific RNA methylase IME4